MKLTTNNVKKICDVLLSESLSVLVLSGSSEEAGLMNHLANDIKKQILSVFDTKEISYETSIVNADEFNDESFILNEFNTESMFMDKRIVIVNNIKPQIAEQFYAFIKDKKSQNIIIMWTNGAIKKSVKKTAIEDSKEMIIVDCYSDSISTIKSFAKQIIQENEFTIDDYSLDVLIESCKGNRFNVKNELDKLMIYKIQDKKIIPQDVIELIFDSANDNVFEKCDEILMLEIKSIDSILGKIISNKGYSGLIANLIPLLKNNLMFLRNILLNTKKNNSTIEDELKLELSRNKAFFLKIDIVRKQLKIWSLGKINNFLIRLAEVEVMARKNHKISNAIVEHSLLMSIVDFRN